MLGVCTSKKIKEAEKYKNFLESLVEYVFSKNQFHVDGNI